MHLSGRFLVSISDLDQAVSINRPSGQVLYCKPLQSKLQCAFLDSISRACCLRHHASIAYVLLPKLHVGHMQAGNGLLTKHAWIILDRAKYMHGSGLT